jgi:hypothetical protein
MFENTRVPSVVNGIVSKTFKYFIFFINFLSLLFRHEILSWVKKYKHEHKLDSGHIMSAVTPYPKIFYLKKGVSLHELRSRLY